MGRVTVGIDVGASHPLHKSRNIAIEVEQSRGSLADSAHGDGCIPLPVIRTEALDGPEVNIAKFHPELAKIPE